jgi:hypothetical protein
MMTARLKRWLPLDPHKGLKALFDGRKAYADLASRCVNVRLNVVRNSGDSKASTSERKDILTNLINAKHHDPGEHLTQTDLETKAFGFMCVLFHCSKTGIEQCASLLTDQSCTTVVSLELILLVPPRLYCSTTFSITVI